MTETQPEWARKGRVPFLDAFRAMAISMVISSHFGISGSGFLGSIFNGHLGVTLFFVISGFLITLLLLREHDASGRISLRAFYYRRVLRIFPAYYTFVIIGLLLLGLGLTSVSKGYWIAAASYMMCYMPALSNGWYIEHSWSLAVEEHFYLLWPLILVVFAPHRAWKIILVYILAIPFIRYGVWALNVAWLDVDFCPITQMNSIAMGCLLAFVVRQDALGGLGLQIQKHSGLVAVMGVGLLVVSGGACGSGKFTIMASDPINAAACFMIIGGMSYCKNRVAGWLLNNRVSGFLGALSYSLYLWQQPLTGPKLVGDLAIPWRLGALFAAAMASYYIVERPFLRMKERAGGATANVKDR